MLGVKLLIFLPSKFLPTGRIRRSLLSLNRLWGSYTFFLFLSAFNLNISIPAWLDLHHTIEDDNGQYFGKMLCILVTSLIGFSAIFFLKKKLSIIQNDKAELSWLYIKKEFRRNAYRYSIIINEICTIRDFLISWLWVLFHNLPHR